MRSTHALLYLVFADISVVNNLRSFERSELERKFLFSRLLEDKRNVWISAS